MLERKIQKVIRDYLKSESNKILVIDGARQIGKSFIIRHEGQLLFPNYIELNMYEDKTGRKIFENIRDVQDFYFRISLAAGDRMGKKKDTLVFIDEIQAYPELLTMLKFLKDDDRFTYIVSGSQLGIALNETLSKPGGRIMTKRMYPLDFEEFLWANNVGKEAVAHLSDCFASKMSLDENAHSYMMDLFRKYLLIGGMPDAVNAFVGTHNLVSVRAVQEEVYKLYREDCSQYDSERKLHIRKIYDLIPSNLENTKKRVKVNEISGKKGKTMSDYEQEFEYIVNSGIALEVSSISNPRFPLRDSMKKSLVKLYLNDVGLLTDLLFKYNASAVLDDVPSINLGSVYENFVASELKAHGYCLYYYDNKKNGEVDFLVDDYDDLTAMPVEVKSGKDNKRHSSLDRFMDVKDYNIKRGLVLSNERTVSVKGRITYLPIYFAMFLNSSGPESIMI